MSDTQNINKALDQVTNGYISRKSGKGDTGNLNRALNEATTAALDRAYNVPAPKPYVPPTPPPITTPPPPTTQYVQPISTTPVTGQPTSYVPSTGEVPENPTPHLFGLPFFPTIDANNVPILGGISQAIDTAFTSPTQTGNAVTGFQAAGGTINDTIKQVMGESDWWKRVVGAETGVGTAAIQAFGGLEGSARDIPVIGTVPRLGEAALNIAGKPFNAVGKPAAGLAGFILGTGLNNARALATGDLQGIRSLDDARTQLLRDTGFANEEQLNRAFAEKPLETLAKIGDTSYGQQNPAVQFALAVAFDPLTWIPGLGIGKRQAARMVEGATQPIEGALKTAEELLPKSRLADEASRVIEMGDTAATHLASKIYNADSMQEALDVAKAYANASKGEDAYQAVSSMYRVNTAYGQRAVRFLDGADEVVTRAEKDLIKNPTQDLAEFKTKLATDLRDTMATNIAKEFPVAPPNTARRMLGGLKSLEAIAYIGLHPLALAHNWINNKMTMLIEGVNPFSRIGSEAERLRALGRVQEARDLENAGALHNFILGGNGVEGSSAVFRRALKQPEIATGFTGQMGGLLARFGEKRTLLGYYGKMENADRGRAWLTGWQKAYKNWDKGRWIPDVPEALAARLQMAGVNPEEIVNVVRDAGTKGGKQEISKAVADYIAGHGFTPVNYEELAKRYQAILTERLPNVQHVITADGLRHEIPLPTEERLIQFAQGVAERVRNGVPYEQAVQQEAAQMVKDTLEGLHGKLGTLTPEMRLQEIATRRAELDTELGKWVGKKGKAAKEARDLIGGEDNALHDEQRALEEQLGYTLEEGLFGKQQVAEAQARSGNLGNIPPEPPVAPLPEPKPPKPPTGGTPKGLQRNWRAGMNNGEIQFESPLQRDLYDYGANIQIAKGKNPRQQAVTLEAIKGRVHSQLPDATENEIRNLGRQVHQDIKAQMSGLKDGETRIVVDNINKAPEPILPPTQPPAAPQGLSEHGKDIARFRELTGREPTQDELFKLAAGDTPEQVANVLPITPSPILSDIRSRADQITEPKINLPLLREWDALFHEGEAENIQRATQRAIGKMTPDLYLERAQSIVTRARESGQTWVSTMGDMFEDRAHYVIDQARNGNPKYLTPEYLDRVANGDALTKLLRGTEHGFDWTRFDRPYEYKPYESFAQYRRRVTDAAIERDFIRPAGDTGVSTTSTGEGSIPPTSAETSGVSSVSDVTQAAPVAPQAAQETAQAAPDFPNFGKLYGVKPTGFPVGGYYAVDATTGETMRFGKPIGQMPKSFKEPEAAAKAAEAWFKKNKPTSAAMRADIAALSPEQLKAKYEQWMQDISQVATPDPLQVKGFNSSEMAKTEAQFAADLSKAMHDYYMEAGGARVANPMTEELGKMLADWKNGQVLPAFDDARAAAAQHGNWLMNATLLNYDRRWNVDNALALYTPFSFWRLHYGVETLRRVLDRPALLSMYLHMAKTLADVHNGPDYPTRFKGLTTLGFPFMPAWAGGQILFDPLEALTNVKQVFGIKDGSTDAEVQDADVALTIRGLAQKGEISASEAANAIANKENSGLWNTTKEQMQSLAQPTGGLSDLFRAHLPLDIAMKVLTGHPEDIGVLFPFTRLIRAAAYATGQQDTRILGAPLGNIEEPLKQGLRALTGNDQIPLYDAYEQYRIDRMLANMVGDGTLSARDALIALIEHKGTAYDEARKRAGQEGIIGAVSPVGGAPFPSGERAYYLAKVARDNLWNSEVARLGMNPATMTQDQKYQTLKENNAFANGGTLSNFYDAHPELGIKTQVFNEPEKRLKDFMLQELGNKYYGLSALDRRLASDTLGDTFKNLFRNKDTRDLTGISLEQLATWTKGLNGYVPQSPDVSLKAGDLPPIQYATPDQSARYQSFSETSDRLFDNPKLQQELDAYHLIPKGDYVSQRAYKAGHPTVAAYLAWYGNWMNANQDIAHLINPETQYGYKRASDVAYSEHLVRSMLASNMARLLGKYGALGGAPRRAPRTYRKTSKYTTKYTSRTPTASFNWNVIPPNILQKLEAKWLYNAYLDPATLAKLLPIYRKYGSWAASVWTWLSWLKKMRYGTLTA